VEQDLNGPPRAVRHKLPEERMSVTHKFNIGGHEGYITVGLYPDGSPGEIFITMAKEGSTVSGLMDSFALAVSIALQHGVPIMPPTPYPASSTWATRRRAASAARSW